VKGNNLNYDVTTKSGVISGDDGNRYIFDSSDWKPANEPKASTKVDFAIEGSSQ